MMRNTQQLLYSGELGMDGTGYTLERSFQPASMGRVAFRRDKHSKHIAHEDKPSLLSSSVHSEDIPKINLYVFLFFLSFILQLAYVCHYYVTYTRSEKGEIPPKRVG
jgi:hypothetical protein